MIKKFNQHKKLKKEAERVDVIESVLRPQINIIMYLLVVKLQMFNHQVAVGLDWDAMPNAKKQKQKQKQNDHRQMMGGGFILLMPKAIYKNH